MKKLLTGAGVVVGFMAIALPALSFAAYMQAGSMVFVSSATTTPGNAYLAGANVDVTNPIGGDLLAAGGTISLTSSVGQDIMAAGGTINIVGASAQDVRAAGGNITIGGKFTGEIVAAGGQIIILPDTTITNDSYLGGGTLTFDGIENGNLALSGGEIRIDGTVMGNVTVKNATKVTIGSHAVIKKNFEYTASAPVVIEPGAQVVGQTTFHQSANPQADKTGVRMILTIITGWLFLKFLIVLTAAYLLWYLRRKDTLDILQNARTHFWKKLLGGFAFLILVPVAVIILLITIIGAIPAIIALLAYLAILILASPFAVIFVASLLKKDHTELAWYHIVLGAVILTIVALIPFVGWIASFIVYLVSLGGLVTVLKTKFQ